MGRDMSQDFQSFDTTLGYGVPFPRHSASPDPAIWLHDYGSSGLQFTSLPIPSYDRSLSDYNVVTYSADRKKATHSRAISRSIVDTQFPWAVHTSFPIKSPSLRKTAPDIDQKIRLNERLQELRQTVLEHVSFDDTSPVQRALAEAGEFIDCLPFPLIFMPEISLARDGEVNFFWQNDMFYLDLGFYGDGNGSCFARTIYGRKIHLDRIAPKGPLPSELHELFNPNKNNPDAFPPS